MKVEIDINEKWSKVAPFFARYPQAVDIVAGRVGEKEVQLEAMTVRDFCEAIDGRVPERLKKEYAAATVGEWCAMQKGLVSSLKRLAGFMDKTTPPQTPEQKKMRTGLLEMSAEEAILLTCKDFYQLHGLEEAQKLTVYEYMIARKAVYNETLQAYNATMAARAASAARR